MRGFVLDFLDGVIVEMIVMVMGEQHRINGRQVRNTRRMHCGKGFAAEERHRGGAVVHRVGQDALPRRLKQ